MSSPSATLRVAVLLYPGCVLAEVVEVATRLSNQGVCVHWVSPSGSPVTDQSMLAVSPDHSIAGLEAVVLDALVVAGGDPASVMGDDMVRTLVRRTADRGTVAAICAGVLVLADAGVLQGRRATHNYRSPWAPPDVAESVAELFNGANVERDPARGVVIDGPVITALPNATVEFSIAVCQSLGLYDDEQAALIVRHLRGEFVPALVDRRAEASLPPARVRMAEPKDVADLVQLQIQLFVEDAGVHEPFVDLMWSEREGRSDIEQLLTSESSLVLVAEFDDQSVGFLVGYLSPPPPTRQPVTFAVLRSLYVAEGYRSSGAGAAMTEQFVEWAAARGAVEAHVSAYAANHGAHRFYERLGFMTRSATRVRKLASD